MSSISRFCFYEKHSWRLIIKGLCSEGGQKCPKSINSAFCLRIIHLHINNRSRHLTLHFKSLRSLNRAKPRHEKNRRKKKYNCAQQLSAKKEKKVEADSSRIHWSNQHKCAIICTRCSLSQRWNTNAKAFCAVSRWTSIKSLAHKTKHFQSLSSIQIKQNRKSKICLWFFSSRKKTFF